MVKLIVEGITCQYDSSDALRDVNLRVEPGDFVGVIGPNGSGKTTLIRALSRALKPSVGTVLLDGVDLYAVPPKSAAKKVAVVPQESTLAFDFTTLEVVLMGRNPHLGTFQFERNLDFQESKQAMESTGCWQLAHRKFFTLSGGERRRVLIARALAQEPKVLLLDEPTVHLDVSHQIEAMELLRNLAKARGLAVVSVFHDFHLASRYCDSGLLLDHGVLAAVGPMEEVLTRQNLSRVFKVEVEILRSKRGAFLTVIPLSVIREQGQSGWKEFPPIAGGGDFP